MNTFGSSLLRISCLIALLSEAIYSNPAAKPVRFVALGHTAFLNSNTEYLEKLTRFINEENVEFVIHLGDGGFSKKENVEFFKSHLDAPVYFSPGPRDLSPEHELKPFSHHVGYTSQLIKTESAYFFVLNSLGTAKNFRNQLDRLSYQLPTHKPWIILTHHRIWDDNFLQTKTYKSRKSYKYSELGITDFHSIKHILSGASTQQYFGNNEHYSTVFYNQMIGHISGYSIGMGNGTPHASYVIGEVKGTQLSVIPRSIEFFMPAATKSVKLPQQTYAQAMISKSKTLSSHMLGHRYLWIGALLGLCIAGLIYIIATRIGDRK